jgi:hypothetical protein
LLSVLMSVLALTRRKRRPEVILAV